MTAEIPQDPQLDQAHQAAKRVLYEGVINGDVNLHQWGVGRELGPQVEIPGDSVHNRVPDPSEALAAQGLDPKAVNYLGTMTPPRAALRLAEMDQAAQSIEPKPPVSV